ncbi:HAD-IA family hydrolase [Desulfobacter latus]|uniref:HAD-IA family hydrolase n=1 Tax=Desulfobacter latus TaxID=2292 RepID=A0A850TEP5_9BACT|nr:HAD-IA family hydrolase [Desulfobacter latus]NWH06757.1 HAD-IA family hydrolase [Desulfobacter latus]
MILDSIQKIPLKIPENIKIISFDLFDTLVMRKTDPPEETIKRTCEKISRMGLIHLSGKKIFELRQKIEKKLRQKSLNSGFDSEISIEDMYLEMIKKTATNLSAKQLLDIELSVELNLLFTNPGIKTVLEQLKEEYRLIITSDTYYPLWMLRCCLEEVGLFDYFDKIYCSSDIKLNKGSGNLFKCILEYENVSSDQIVHLGDNALSDYNVPRNLGIQSFLILDPWNLKRRARTRLLNRYERREGMWQACSFFNKLTIKNPHLDEDADKFVSWGKEVVGPLLVVFVHLFIKQVLHKNISQIHFLARDGFVLKKIYNTLSNGLYQGTLPHSHYLCVSRQSTFAPSIRKLDDRIYRHSISGINITTRSVLNRLKLNDCDLITQLLDKYNLSYDDPIDNDTTRQKIKILFKDNDFQTIVLENAKELRIVFRQYLEKHSFFNKNNNTALVDVGWIGTIQDNIEAMFSDTPDYPELIGYYLGSSQSIDKDKIDYKKIGLLYDYKMAVPEQVAISFFREALEFSTRALHGTTTGYRMNEWEDYPTVIFKKASIDRQNEKDINTDIIKIQKGIYAFLSDYIKLQKVYPIEPEQLKTYVISRYDNYLSFPRQRHISAISGLINAEDFGGDEVREIIGQCSITDVFNPRWLFADFLDIPWREASLAKTKIPFLNILYFTFKRIIIWNRLGKSVKDER